MYHSQKKNRSIIFFQKMEILDDKEVATESKEVNKLMHSQCGVQIVSSWKPECSTSWEVQYNKNRECL